MSKAAGPGFLRVVEQQYGTLLRLQASAISARGAAAGLLGLLEAELDAEVEDNGWKRGNKLNVATPILVQLESLGAEVTVDGNEIVLRRVAGSTHEFEELCEFLREHGSVS